MWGKIYLIKRLRGGKDGDMTAANFKGKWFIIYTEEPSMRAAFDLYRRL
jgi:hypothetical protein